MIYLVLSPGRTGSTLLSELIRHHVGAEVGIYYEHRTSVPPKGKPQVIHTHDQLFVDNNSFQYKEVSLIISRRRDIFATLMSTAISRHTNEYLKYSHRKFAPFSIPLSEFAGNYKNLISWYQEMNLSHPYHSITTVYHEDVLDAMKHFNDILGLTKNRFYVEKSPYRYQDLVINWEELYTEYLTLIENTQSATVTSL